MSVPKRRFQLISELSEEQRERIRARDRARYQRKQARLKADPEAMEIFRQKARERTRRYSQRHAEKLAVERRERERVRYAADAAYREKRVQRQRDYVERNRAAVYKRNRDYSARNREKRSAQYKSWRMANIEQIRPKERERNRAKYEADPKAINLYNRTWRQKNPEKARLYIRLSGHKRRAAAGSAHWTRAEWLALLEQYGGRCHYCGTDGPMQADHLIPLSRGGPNTIENLVPACKSCNCRKHDRTEEEFRVYLEERARRRRSA